MEEKENYFIELNKVKCEVEKKNGFNYISWADGWAEVKKLHPTATYRKIVNELDNTFLFKSGNGGMVVCEVTINGISHSADLAITSLTNQEIAYDNIKSTDIQNTSQRAFAKAIAMHGIGLYVYRGEDLPEQPKPVFDTEALDKFKVHVGNYKTAKEALDAIVGKYDVPEDMETNITLLYNK